MISFLDEVAVATAAAGSSIAVASEWLSPARYTAAVQASQVTEPCIGESAGAPHLMSHRLRRSSPAAAAVAGCFMNEDPSRGAGYWQQRVQDGFALSFRRVAPDIVCPSTSRSRQHTSPIQACEILASSSAFMRAVSVIEYVIYAQSPSKRA